MSHKKNGLPEDGMRLCHIAGEPARLVRHKGECFAIGATCAHYGGPLAEGIVADGAVRCPWSFAPRLLRSAHRRGHTPACARAGRPLAGERKGNTVFACD
jgi:hypothetical protein